MILAKHSIPSVLYYRPETKFAKVIFYNCLSVILFTAGGGSASRGVCMQWGWADTPPPQSDTMGYSERAGGTHPTGMHFVLDKNIFRKMYVQ